jgi:RNA polymerase sigma-70 factor (ECF subfamily)
VEIARWDERELVRRCKEGSEAAFAELVRRHRPRLFTLAYRLTGDGDTAEDVVQETFVAAFRALDRFEPRPSLAAWLNTIALRNAGRVAAKATARASTSLDLVDEYDEAARRHIDARAASAEDPSQAAEAAELRREVAAAIAALPFRYRAAVVTRYILGLDYAEAAASLEMGLNTYKSQLLRGTKMLREALAPAVGREIPDLGEPRVVAQRRDVPEPRPTAASGENVVLEAHASHAGSTAAVTSATAVGAGAHTARVPAARSFAVGRRSRFGTSVSKE